MTDEQSRRFDDLGCVPRCLMRLSEAEGHPISKEQFCALFESYFTNPATDYGLLEDPGFSRVCEQLPIPQRRGVHGDYEVVRRCFRPSTMRVFLISLVDLRPSLTDPNKHCSIVTHMTPERFSIWTPFKGGGDGLMDFLRPDWEDKKCTGLIFW